MSFKHTNRGFELIDFKDAGGYPCSLQESSAVMTVNIISVLVVAGRN